MPPAPLASSLQRFAIPALWYVKRKGWPIVEAKKFDSLSQLCVKRLPFQQIHYNKRREIPLPKISRLSNSLYGLAIQFASRVALFEPFVQSCKKKPPGKTNPILFYR